ncbi:hypothetical protein GYMLUDRAFT_1002773 [Collybiopsis luxurians FD-317 M1]|nr:hypothetical protein GYMLUDRAFT_1002773 [Collybiopsis luxurians FD-317 M1]
MKFSIVSVCLGLSAVGLVAAQQLSSCATACVSQAAEKDGCGSFTNITCVCTNAQFQADALSCLTAECSASDLTTLQGLQATECGAAQLSATGSVTDTSVFSATGVSSGTGTSLSIPSSGAASSGASSSGSGSTTGSASGTSSAAASGSGTATTASGSGGATTAAATSPAATTSTGAAQNLQVPFGLGLIALVAGLL